MNSYDFLHFVRHNKAFFALDCSSNEEVLLRFLPLWDGFQLRELFLPYECFEDQISAIIKHSVVSRLSNLISNLSSDSSEAILHGLDARATDLKAFFLPYESYEGEASAMIERFIANRRSNLINNLGIDESESISQNLGTPEAHLDFILDSFLETHRQFEGQNGWDTLRTHKVVRFDALIVDGFFKRPMMYWNSVNKLTSVNFLMFLFGVRCGTKVLGDIAEYVPSIDGLFSFLFEHYKLRSFSDLIAYFAVVEKENSNKVLGTLRHDINNWFIFWKELHGPFEYLE